MANKSKGFWNVPTNIGLGIADIGLSALGANNVIQTDDYLGNSANSFGVVTDVVGSAAKVAAPMVANAIVPGSGMIISGAQRIGGSMNPQNVSGDRGAMITGKSLELAGSLASPFLGSIGTGGAPAGTMSGLSSSGAVSMAPSTPVFAKYGAMMKYKMGGNPNAEVENNEYITTNIPPTVYEGGGIELVSNNPYGTPTYETNGRTHEDGGIVTELAPGTIINGKTKNPETGNKFSVDMEKLTNKESKYTKMLAKATDKRTRESIQTSLQMLASEKERLNNLQQSIIETKEKNQMEKDFFELGGMVSYKDGGIHINPKNKGKFTAAAKRAGMGVQEYARHVLANKENYSSTLVKRANFARNAAKWKHEEGGQIPNRFYPTSDEYGIYEQGGFLPLHLANRFYPDTSVGGMMKFTSGGKLPIGILKSRLEAHMSKEEARDYLDKYALGDEVPETMPSVKPHIIQPRLSRNPEVEDPKIKGGIKDTSNWKMMLPKPDEDFRTSLKEYAPNIIGGLAENLGNLWVMAEKGPEEVKYDRYTASYLDPTESMREADRQARIAAYEIANKGAGRGEFIGARSRMAADAANLKDKYAREYGNINANIRNEMNKLNVGISQSEKDTQAMNDAAYRSMRRAAVGSIGTNIAGTTKDIRSYNRDKEMIEMLPELYNSPEFKEFFKSYRTKRSGK